MRQAALKSNEARQAPPMRPSRRRGRTISSSARGAKQTTPHGPLQRLLDVMARGALMLSVNDEVSDSKCRHHHSKIESNK